MPAASPYHHSSAASYHPRSTVANYQQPSSFAKQAPPVPPRQCRDVIWGILFYAHLGVMAYLAARYAPQAVNGAVESYAQATGGGRRTLDVRGSVFRFLQDDGEDGEGSDELSIDPQALLVILSLAGVLGSVLSSLAMTVMMTFAEGLIKIALWFNILIFAFMALVSLITGAIGGVLMGLAFCAISAYYAWNVWNRIPFAASNLVTAVTAVRANIGLAFYAYLSLVLLFGWSIWWTVSSVSTLMVVSECDGDGECAKEISGLLVFLFFISYYWTIQVITNVVYVSSKSMFRICSRRTNSQANSWSSLNLQARHNRWHRRNLVVRTHGGEWLLF
jgi:hypothetical protein